MVRSTNSAPSSEETTEMRPVPEGAGAAGDAGLELLGVVVHLALDHQDAGGAAVVGHEVAVVELGPPVARSTARPAGLEGGEGAVGVEGVREAEPEDVGRGDDALGLAGGTPP